MLACLCLLVMLVMPPAAQAQNCACSGASLMGDSVGTQFASGPVITRTVVGTAELTAAGPILGALGPSPRWNIDFTANTIRIDFVGQAAGYGGGAPFTFSSLDPNLPSGCSGTPYISGMTVTTNKVGVPFVSANATFTQHQVAVPLSPGVGTTTNWNPGEFILITFQFACSPTVDPCCPPWNSTKLQDMLVYQGTGGISAPYTLHFTPTAAFNAQMQAYINYLNTVNPAITAITINFKLRDGGTGTTSVPAATIQPASLTWNANSSTMPTSNFFNAGLMAINRWYRVETTIGLNNNIQFFPQTCVNNYTDIRLQLVPKPPGGPDAGNLRMRLPDKREITRTIQAAQ
jgi:hypothetical protein